MPGLGMTYRPPTMAPPVQRPPAIGGAPALPGTAEYSRAYGEWMKTPEAQATFHQQAVDQAKFANTINPYSDQYNEGAAKAVKDAAASGTAADYYTNGAGKFREAMGQAILAPATGPAPMPLTPGRPPQATPGPMPPTPAGGMNNFDAAATLRRRRKPRIPGTGPTAPPVLA